MSTENVFFVKITILYTATRFLSLDFGLDKQ